ncbi:MAG: S46 family peptidase [Alistipes sp.]|nr:S46 family peptidase [Alistipes sp.]
MKKLFFSVIAAVLFSTFAARADEGMWLLPALKAMNIIDMQSKGLEISAEDIYNANGNSLKDAIVIFANGCTGEIVSPDGLLFTNHHCGYGVIQALSSVENDFLKYGYWAQDRSQELPYEGLSVTFIRHIEDVTERLLEGIELSLPQVEREEKLAEVISALTEEYSGRPEFEGMTVRINSFYGGNRYILFANEIYKDVRLVGTPPNSIGKFGADTDNWMWPRHTGDFSVFRVYADKDGKPAEYSPDNVPYQSPVHLKISLRGVEEGDYAMVMGFPGSTQRYMTSYEIDQVLNFDFPNRIRIRGMRQDILRDAMYADDAVRIKYAAKFSSSTNTWKNSIGMSGALVKLGVKQQKQAQEESFRAWAAADPSRAVYTAALDKIAESVEGRIPSAHASQYMAETLMRGVELVTAASLSSSVQTGRDTISDAYIQRIITNSQKNFYKDYETELDRKVAKIMLPLLRDNIPVESLPSFYGVIDNDFNGNMDAYVDYLFENSLFTSHESFSAALEARDFDRIASDPAVDFRESVQEAYQAATKELGRWNELYREGHRLYVAGLLEMEPDKLHYPDANFTIRLTYGTVKPYKPRDAVWYDYWTTLTGVMEKEDPTNPEFVVPEKLKELYYTQDYGPYGKYGQMPVCFLFDGDITGGNSGSPVLNSRGELIGLAFDGNWEAMSGDITFEPELQRCINVDIRYVLFIIDKYANAGYLLDELTIVE